MKTCKRCGGQNFYLPRGQCKDCTKVTQAKYRANNSGKVKAYQVAYSLLHAEKKKAYTKKWTLANPEKVKASYEKRYAANPEKAIARVRKWRENNPEAHRIQNQNRDAKKRASGGKLSVGLTDKLLKLQKGKCPCCNKPLGDNYHLDHIMPIALGGENIDANIQLLRSTCNIQKHAKHPVAFMQSRGFLL